MPDDVAKYDDFWAAFFGLEAAQLRRTGVNVVRHAHLGQYQQYATHVAVRVQQKAS